MKTIKVDRKPIIKDPIKMTSDFCIKYVKDKKIYKRQ